MKSLSPAQVLQQSFGFQQFRGQQKEIIDHLLQGKDAMVLMPTGGGKSICYQLPALILPGLTIVVSPLIALMKDQVDALRLNGVAAEFLNSTLDYYQQQSILQQLENGQLKLLYVAPERLMANEGAFLKKLKQHQVSLFAIDEAHCISHWGHDFRPDYRLLENVKTVYPSVPMVALTATADKLTRQDIVKKLNLKAPGIFVSSFNRANIRYTVVPKRDSYESLLQFLSKFPGEGGIIYCLSRASTESLAVKLEEDGFQALPYHAGLNRETRELHQNKFQKDEVQIIVATIAFGMGIDKSNVRFVVHMDLPKNIESYYQETGRAGRDGLPSEVLLFYSFGDVIKMKNFINLPDHPHQEKILHKKLMQMSSFCEINTCRRQFLLRYFDEESGDYCGECDHCLGKYEKVESTVPAQKVLSAVARLKESYGAGYLVDFLKGSSSQRIKSYHKSLKTFGVGNEWSGSQWKDFIDDLVTNNYLEKSTGSYPVLKLNEESWKVLKGESEVWLRKRKKQVVVQTERNETEGLIKELYQDLKILRRQIADSEGLAPYLILSDASLQELATYLPLKTTDLTLISGFGKIKTEKYGFAFLATIKDYCEQAGLVSRMANKRNAPRKRSSNGPGPLSSTKLESFKLFQAGNSIEEIAQKRTLTTSTVETHLAHFISTGDLNLDAMVDTEKQVTIKKGVDTWDGVSLKALKDRLGKDVSYGEIKMVMAEMSRK